MDDDSEYKPGKFESDMDQLFTALENMARMLGDYRANLIKVGFSPEVAEQLVVVYMQGMHR
jgi:hypothetical protein